MQWEKRGKKYAANRTFTPSGIVTSYVMFREQGVIDDGIDLGSAKPNDSELYTRHISRAKMRADGSMALRADGSMASKSKDRSEVSDGK